MNLLDLVRIKLKQQPPCIVCLCGSTRFSEAFQQAMLEETLAGRIVLTIGCVWHSDEALGLTEADKECLDILHLFKIDISDEVLILNVNGYIGESTEREIEYARSMGKPIRWLEEKSEEQDAHSASQDR